MALALGLLSLVLALGLAVLLPVISWVRTARLERELRQLRARLAALELRESAAVTAPPAPPQPAAAAPVPPTSTVTPEPEAVESLPVAVAPDGLTPPPLPAPSPIPAPESTGLEEAIGGRLMLWVGAIVLVLGVAFFIKYAFENDWITESMRVALGIGIGLSLAFVGDRLAGRGYRAYGQVIAGAGIAAIFLAIYTAFAYYNLIDREIAFALLVLVTAGAAVLADRREALWLAVMAVGGGFLTPFLVSSGTDAQLTLFSYDALLVAGTLFLAIRHDWPILNVLSFACTWLTVLAWFETYYTPAKWLRTEIFLVLYCVLFIGILRAQIRQRGWRDPLSLVLGLGPIVFHVLSLAVLSSQGTGLWVYLIAVTLVAVVAGVRVGSTALRLIAWFLVIVPLIAWTDSHQHGRWLIANLVSALAVFALHALGQLDVVIRKEQPLSRLDNLLQHLNGYALIVLVYDALEHVALASIPGVVAIVGLVHVGLAGWLRKPDRRAALHALAVAVGAFTIALAIRLDGPWLTVALGIEGLAVIAVGLQIGERWFRLGGFAVIAAGVLRYVALSLPATPTVFHLFRDEPCAIGLFLAAVLYAVAWRYRSHATDGQSQETRLAIIVSVLSACVLLVVALSAENDIYWTLRGDTLADAGFARSLALSVIWTLSASVFIGAGLRREFAPVRYLAMALFGLTVLKVFLVDLSALGGIYRILGFIGLGAVLLAVSFLYQRTRKKMADGRMGG